MKVKLLKKVRRNYRIVTNELGNSKVQERWLLGWCDLEDEHGWLLYMHSVITKKRLSLHGSILVVLHNRYDRYHRKTKIERVKQNKWTVRR
jgi:hypothetical protein